MYIYRWKFQVKADCIQQFEMLYGQDGAWVALFKKNKAYIKTELLRSTLHDNEYTTTDYWRSKADYDLFCQKYQAEFAALDKLGEALTLKEEFIGESDITSGI